MEFNLPLPKNPIETSLSFTALTCLRDRLKSHLIREEDGSNDNAALQLRCSILFHVAGREVIELLKRGSSLLSSKYENGDLELSKLLEQIENIILPNFILLYERYKFFTRVQLKEEQNCKFISDIESLAQNCDFQEHHEYYVKNRLIEGAQAESLKLHLKEIQDLKLHKVVEICHERDGLCRGHCLYHKVSKPSGRSRRTLVTECRKDKESEKTVQTTGVNVKNFNMKKTRGRPRKCKNELSVQNVNECFQGQTDLSSRSQRPRRKCTQLIFNSNEKKECTTIPASNFELETTVAVTALCKDKKSSHNSSSESIHPPLLIQKGTDDQGIDGDISSTSIREDEDGDVMNKMLTVNESCFRIEKKINCGVVDLEVKEKDHDLCIEKNIEKESERDSSAPVMETELKNTEKTCPICGLICKSNILKYHMRTHTGKRAYKCDICSKDFAYSSYRTKHMRQNHPEMMTFKCEECSMTFEFQRSLDLHMISHTKEAKLECQDCDKVFTNVREHHQHRRKEHRSMRYPCNICGLHFPYPSKLKLHLMSKHNATKPYMCEVCGSSFAEKSILLNHKNIHTGEKRHECTTCGRRFLLKTTLNNHIYTHIDQKLHTCEVCGLSFKLAYYLKNHMKIHSQNRERPHICSTCGLAFLKSYQLRNHERKHTGEKPFKCDVCGMTFSQTSSMKKHLRRIHEGVKPKDRFSCEYCGLSFTHSCKLKLHLMKHTGERPFVCKVCGVSYRENHQLNKHIKTHSGQEPFKCSICGQKFLQRSQMEGHVRKHTGEKPFPCSVCGTRFSLKGYLRDHLKIHDSNRERRYKCGICGKAFTCSSHMRSHERLHAGEKPHKCHICGSKFTKRSSVMKHLKRTHRILNPDHPSITQEQPVNVQHGTAEPHTILDISSQVHHQEISTDLSSDLHTPLHHQGIPDISTEVCGEHPNHLLVEMQGLHMVPKLSHGLHLMQSVSSEIHLQMHHDLHSQMSHEPTPQLNPLIHPKVHSNIHGYTMTN